jgi:hypothetical protein
VQNFAQSPFGPRRETERHSRSEVVETLSSRIYANPVSVSSSEFLALASNLRARFGSIWTRRRDSIQSGFTTKHLLNGRNFPGQVSTGSESTGLRTLPVPAHCLRATSRMPSDNDTTLAG